MEVKVEAKADEKKAEVKKKSLITRFLDYFNDANKKNDKRFDFSIIGGPHYATDTKLGLGSPAIPRVGKRRHVRHESRSCFMCYVYNNV